MKLVNKSQVSIKSIDKRFNYEPMLSSHPTGLLEKKFLGKTIGAPIFISSITGGSSKSKTINKRLGKTAKEFKLPMGLGSIRPYLENVEKESFDIRKYTGYDVQLFGNIGISQVEKILLNDNIKKLKNVIQNLELNGIIIHINPLQEWVQEGGDRLQKSPISTLKDFLPMLNCTTIIKEVGCGFGPESLESLIKLPVDVIDFAAFGGTNFTKMELLRQKNFKKNFSRPLINIGNTPEEMILSLNNLNKKYDLSTKEFIVSGGIKNFLDGYYYNSLLSNNSIYGYAGKLLQLASKSEKNIMNFIEKEIKSYNFCECFLKIK